MHFTSSSLVATFTLCLSVLASPPVVKRQNAAPAVIYPSSGSLWTQGARHNVTWDPSGATGNDASIYVVKAGGVVDPTPLATGVDLTRGRVEVTVPNLPPSSDYSILLVSDGGRSSSTGSPFSLAQSANDRPPAAQSLSDGQVTTVTFGSTTVVATAPFSQITVPGVGVIGAGANGGNSPGANAGSSSASGSGSAASSAASITSSASSAISAASSSASEAQSSAQNSISSALSSAQSSLSSATATSPSGSGASATGSNGAALSAVHLDFTGLKLVAASVAIALSAGAMIL